MRKVQGGREARMERESETERDRQIECLCGTVDIALLITLLLFHSAVEVAQSHALVLRAEGINDICLTFGLFLTQCYAQSLTFI